MQLDHLQLQRYSSNLFSMDVQLLLLVITVTLIGIPHGYFDFLIAKKLYSNLNNWLLKFILIYLATSLLYLYVWTVLPTFALIIFLLMAQYHFAIEETTNQKSSNAILMLIVGGIPIFTPIIFHAVDVFSLFSILLSTELYHPEFSIVHHSLYILTVLIIIFSYARNLSLLYTLLLVNFIFLPPLISFILYFCFHHSLRHYLEALSDSNLFDKKIPLTRYVLFFLFLTVAFTSVTLLSLSTLGQISFESAIIKYKFITLACLTLPHLLINLIYDSKVSKPS